jgi:hypothetical protein
MDSNRVLRGLERLVRSAGTALSGRFKDRFWSSDLVVANLVRHGASYHDVTLLDLNQLGQQQTSAAFFIHQTNPQSIASPSDRLLAASVLLSLG